MVYILSYILINLFSYVLHYIDPSSYIIRGLKYVGCNYLIHIFIIYVLCAWKTMLMYGYLLLNSVHTSLVSGDALQQNHNLILVRSAIISMEIMGKHN